MLSPKELRSRRIAMRLTATELAARLGVPPTAVDAWERGDEPIDDPTLLARLDSLEDEDDEPQSQSAR
ncbi:MAG TPA: helix-turn-helix transcriptional regulator [Thermoanaerobaculia bacterium]|nr:helix-turn-helix transcriptional regulator [Thermoanaerobaculia bacterium]